MIQEYDCNYSKFDLQRQVSTYPHYLEVITLEDGTVEYAHPSHQQKLIKLACDSIGCNRDTLQWLCPEEYYFNFDTWLCKMSRCVSVWTKFYLAPDGLNDAQRNTLELLISAGAFEGTLSDNIYNK